MIDEKHAVPTSRAKYFTLAALVIWVVSVFVFSILKFTKALG